ncbi:MAG: amino acid adenylation domain-containing protein, partial [Pseudomonadota bacterium]
DRKALPAPDQGALIVRQYVAPQGQFEEAIGAIWCALLGLERVGREDDFFALGGHSLLAVQLAARMREQLGVEPPLGALFDNPTLAGFARVAGGARRTAMASIAPAARDGALPLSFAQERLWFLDQLDHAAGVAYHMPAALRLKGTLDKPALREALDRIVARHEVLRTRFGSAKGEAVQLIADADCGFELGERDLGDLSGHERENAVSMAGTDEALRPFDLAAGPLVRGQLLRLGDDEHILLVTQHHIISDAWSIGILVRELSTLYGAFSQGRSDPLLPLPIQYADFALWQRGALQGETLAAQSAFWKAQLDGAPALLELPTDRARPALQSHEGASIDFTLPSELSTRLRALGQGKGATLFMTLLSAWAALLSRMSGQQDVVIGTPVANRRRAELEGLIGFFVNTLALRVRVDETMDVAQLLAQVKATSVAAFDHQDLPFEQVVDAVQPTRSTSHTPLFQVLFSMDNTPAGSVLHLPGLCISEIEQATTSSQFDLVLAMSETGDTLSARLSYATALFDADTVARLAGHFQTLLAGMADDESRLVLDLPMLSPAERVQLLETFNDTAVGYAGELLMHQLFEAQAASSPDAIALEFEQHKLSYRELNRRANQLAHHLLALGVKPDQCVAICIDRSLEMVVALLAVLKAGAAYVPLDPAYPAERLAFMLGDCAPVAMLTLDSQAGRPLTTAPLVLLDADAERIGAQSEHNPDVGALGLSSEHLAYVIYTSGSTGQPKGVMNHHAGLRNLVRTQIGTYGIGPDSRVLQFVSLSFDVCVSEISVALCSGACLVVARAAALLPGPELLATLDDYRITHVSLPAAALAALPSQARLGHVEALIVGGEALPPALARHWSAQCKVFNAYGPTEATVCTLNYEYRERQLASVPIGRPMANTRVYILDGRGQPVPLGVTGEIYLGGVQVARGYLNRPQLSVERFVPDRFDGGEGARLYRTGDLGRWMADGNVVYVGRNDTQVKIRGFRIELGEIEARLAACDGVREALVLARADADGDKRLVAYVVAQDGAQPTAESLRAALAQGLAEHMVPSAYVVCEKFPLTPNGKLDHEALPAPARAVGRSYVAPRSAVEETICAIWAALLKTDQVGVNDNFFELGGHSLLLVKLHSAMDAQFPGRLAISDYFKYTSIAQLAELLEQAPQAALASADAQRDEARRSRQANLQENRVRRAARQQTGG